MRIQRAVFWFLAVTVPGGVLYYLDPLGGLIWAIFLIASVARPRRKSER